MRTDRAWIENLPPVAVKALRLVEGVDVGVHASFFRDNPYHFAEYRPYVPGDPLRLVDWKVYARTDRLYVKKFFPYTASDVWLGIDSSLSMLEPFAEKWEQACLLVLALSFLYLRQGDRVHLLFLKEKQLAYHKLGGFQDWGKAALLLDKFQPEGKTLPDRWFAWLSQKMSSRSILILVSDFLAPGELTPMHLAARHDLSFFHLLHQEEKRLLSENVLLQDVETKALTYLSHRSEFEAAWSRFLKALDAGCKQRGISLYRHYAPASLQPMVLAYVQERITKSTRLKKTTRSSVKGNLLTR